MDNRCVNGNHLASGVIIREVVEQEKVQRFEAEKLMETLEKTLKKKYDFLISLAPWTSRSVQLIFSSSLSTSSRSIKVNIAVNPVSPYEEDNATFLSVQRHYNLQRELLIRHPHT